jgi:hypothetical protein
VHSHIRDELGFPLGQLSISLGKGMLVFLRTLLHGGDLFV